MGRALPWCTLVAACACSAPPTPAPALAPATTAPDGGAAMATDAAIARPPIECPGSGRPVRAAWPARGLECRDRGGALDGPALVRYPDGAIAVRAHYRAGALDGAWQRFAPDGALAVEGAYAGGRLDGTWRQLAGGVELGRSQLTGGTGVLATWHPGGALASETGWKDGLRDGPARQLASDGTVVVSERWRAGVRDGARAIGSHASLSLDETWQAGVRVGARTLWRRGHLELDERRDRSGALDGPWTAYRSARHLREQGQYAGGLRTGTWTEYDAAGHPTEQGDYARGLREGAWTRWAKQKVIWTGSYRHGLPDGDFVSFDRKGQELGRDSLVRGTGTLRTFHASGKTETETPLRRGQRHGLFRQWSARGTLIASGGFVDGARDGLWWRTSGGARREATYAAGVLDGEVRRTRAGTPALAAGYAHGLRDGDYTEHYPDGTPAWTGHYAADLRDGDWISYRPDGTVAIRAHYAAGLLDGAWQELDRDGTVRVAGQHQRGHRVGVWTTLDGSGAPTTVDHGPPD